MLTTILLPFAAFALALLLIGGAIFVAGVAYRWPGRIFHALMLMVTTASVGTILLSGRVLTMSDQGLLVGSDDDAGSGFLAKALLVLAVGSAFASCIAWLLGSKNRKTTASRFAERGVLAPSDIATALIAFYVAFSLLPIFFGHRFYFHISLVYPLFVFVALLLWVQLSSIDPVVVAKQCLGIVVFGSLVVAIVEPQFAMQPGYIGLIPGFTSRLWGLTASANTLGSVASVFLVLEAAEPTARKWKRISILTASVFALILSQSKTAILASLIGLSIILIWRFVQNSYRETRSGRQKGELIVICALAALMIGSALLGGWSMFSDWSLLSAVERKLEMRAIGDLTTATGRTSIWTMAIQGGMENPLFGQGGGFWGLENRLQSGLTGAVHAHNLFLQAFSRSGFVGLTALLVFLYFLVCYSLRAATITRGGSIALLVVFFLRAMTEVPLQPNSILGGEFLAMIAYLLYVVDRGAKPKLRSGKTASYDRLGHAFK